MDSLRYFFNPARRSPQEVHHFFNRIELRLVETLCKVEIPALFEGGRDPQHIQRLKSPAENQEAGVGESADVVIFARFLAANGGWSRASHLWLFLNVSFSNAL